MSVSCTTATAWLNQIECKCAASFPGRWQHRAGGGPRVLAAHHHALSVAAQIGYPRHSSSAQRRRDLFGRMYLSSQVGGLASHVCNMPISLLAQLCALRLAPLALRRDRYRYRVVPRPVRDSRLCAVPIYGILIIDHTRAGLAAQHDTPCTQLSPAMVEYASQSRLSPPSLYICRAPGAKRPSPTTLVRTSPRQLRAS